MPPPIRISTETVTLVGAGDIAVCGYINAELTARLLDSIQGTIFTAGDNAYQDGTRENFAQCYEPTWGRHKARTRPSPGDHDYRTPGAEGYFEYFGSQAGPSGLGYYSYQIGAWHVLALNSNVDAEPGSAQYEWLLSELRTDRSPCRIAYWHFPVFNSGFAGNLPRMGAIWQLLARFGTDIVVAGHAHDYERFTRLDGDGNPDAKNGIREFVVGTGGGSYTPQPSQIQANSEMFKANALGVIKFVLEPNGYSWTFVPVYGQTFTDSGSETCSTK